MDLGGGADTEATGFERGDRVVMFAGVAANQEVLKRIDYGTPEFWGGGIRRPRMVFQATVMPGRNSKLTAGPYSPFVEIECEAVCDSYNPPQGHRVLAAQDLSDRGLRLVATSQHKDIPAALIEEVMVLVKQELPKLSAFLERVGFSMEPRAFGSGR
jgi:hypothetical protein